MGTRKFSALSVLKTHFNSIDNGFLEEFMYRIMSRLADFFWVLACKLFFHIYGCIIGFIFRPRVEDGSRKIGIPPGNLTVSEPDGSGNKESSEFLSGFRFQNHQREDSVFVESSLLYPNTSKLYQFISSKDFRGFVQEPETMSSFKVQESFAGNRNHDPELSSEESQESLTEDDHQMSILLSSDEDSQEFDSEAEGKTENDPEDSVFVDSSLIPNTSKYQFISSKDFWGFVQEPKTMSFTIEESVVGNKNQDQGLKSEELLAENDQISNLLSDDEDSHEFDSEPEEKTEDCAESQRRENAAENPEQAISTEFDLHGNKNMAGYVNDHLGTSNLSDEVELLSEDIFLPLGSLIVKIPNSEGMEGVFNGDEVEDTDDDEDEYTEFEPNLQSPNHLVKHFPGKEPRENLQNPETEPPVHGSGKSWGSGYEEDDDEGDDVLLKHQDLIEQMKMEMKNSRRNKGLPTILEESETTPKMTEDLKPLKIEEKLEYKDRVEEIQKVYKGYAEKMRKLDVLNYQTLHAISFLQLKDPVDQGASAQKTSSSVSAAIKCLLLPCSLWPGKLRRIYADPTLVRSITEMHRNLEAVYVGQVCLSWEILNWQYGKANELLLEHDLEGQNAYSRVASEFQQFQVLVERFVEDEMFLGPRVQNYAKYRSELRTFLQVPAIRDDCLKDSRFDEGNIVSIGMLAETINESMHAFWEFLRADKDKDKDKDEASVILKGLQPSSRHVHQLQDPSDSELLMDIKTSLQKKEKRLKDIVRSTGEYCIVKLFQKHGQERRMECSLLIAQVELKLVSRVLNLQRLTTEHLVWCRKKLNRTNFVNRKIHVQPSFLLFPL